MIGSVTLTRVEAEGASTDVESRPARWEPAVWTTERNGLRLLVKDAHRTAWPYRFTLGRWLLRREARLNRQLEGLAFVPRCHGPLDRDAIVFDLLDAVPLTSESQIGAEFFDELQDQLRAIHERGVVHLDLRHRTNIMVDPDGRPRIIDFGAALSLGRSGPLRRLFLPLFAAIDRSAALKWRIRYAPGSLSPGDAAWYLRFQRRRFLFWPFGRRGKRRWPTTPQG